MFEKSISRDVDLSEKVKEEREAVFVDFRESHQSHNLESDESYMDV